MAIYEVTLPAVGHVEADNIEEAKQKGLDRVNFNYFTSFDKEDIISIKITTEYKICPHCKFYVIPISAEKCGRTDCA